MRKFPGGLEVRILDLHCCGPGSVTTWRTEILKAAWHGKKNKNKQVKLIYL